MFMGILPIVSNEELKLSKKTLKNLKTLKYGH